MTNHSSGRLDPGVKAQWSSGCCNRTRTRMPCDPPGWTCGSRMSKKIRQGAFLLGGVGVHGGILQSSTAPELGSVATTDQGRWKAKIASRRRLMSADCLSSFPPTLFNLFPMASSSRALRSGLTGTAKNISRRVRGRKAQQPAMQPPADP